MSKSYGVICFRFRELNMNEENIEFLLIRRLHSLNYVDFIRGKYRLNDFSKIKKIFLSMTQEEVIKIKELSFDDMWNDIWKDTAFNEQYKNEYKSSKTKFNFLKKKNFYDIIETNTIIYTEPEWDFPKGRLEQNETIKECALREFNEETNINNINIIDNITINELINGSNNKTYEYLYYLAFMEEKHELEIVNEFQKKEIGSIQFLTLPEIKNKIRSYYPQKIETIKTAIEFIKNYFNITQ
jgi:8-oxo-dGTP pyrophosphatase MutT (NUDIX family)